jgi:IstB-like ATP binding protein
VRSYHWLSLTKSLRWRLAVVDGAGPDGSESWSLIRVRYVPAAKLVNELVEAADDKPFNKTIARYGRVDLLCIDELGYMELDRRRAELLFQVLTECPGRLPGDPGTRFWGTWASGTSCGPDRFRQGMSV